MIVSWETPALNCLATLWKLLLKLAEVGDWVKAWSCGGWNWSKRQLPAPFVDRQSQALASTLAIAAVPTAPWPTPAVASTTPCVRDDNTTKSTSMEAQVRTLWLAQDTLVGKLKSLQGVILAPNQGRCWRTSYLTVRYQLRVGEIGANPHLHLRR